jgi:uncharacterized delta-60 repeat protein
MVIAGQDNNTHIKLARILSDGTLDTSFGTNGTATVSGIQLNARQLAVDAQNKIILPIRVIVNGIITQTFAVLRLNADGTPDTGFGTGGQVTVDFSGNAQALAAAVLPNGKIMVTGMGPDGTSTSNGAGDFAAVRLNSDGQPDTTFGAGGKLLFGTDQPDVPQLSEQEAWNAVVALPNNGALMLGTGFGRTSFSGSTYVVLAQVNP